MFVDSQYLMYTDKQETNHQGVSCRNGMLLPNYCRLYVCRLLFQLKRWTFLSKIVGSETYVCTYKSPGNSNLSKYIVSLTNLFFTQEFREIVLTNNIVGIASRSAIVIFVLTCCLELCKFDNQRLKIRPKYIYVQIVA